MGDWTDAEYGMGLIKYENTLRAFDYNQLQVIPLLLVTTEVNDQWSLQAKKYLQSSCFLA